MRRKLTRQTNPLTASSSSPISRELEQISQSKSILQENIKSLAEETWEAIHSPIIGYAQSEKIETGRKIRIDSAAIETDIHHPTDSTLLGDGIRVIIRWLAAGKQLSPQPVYPFSDHIGAAKKRLMVILNTPKEKARLAAYRELLSYVHRVMVYDESAIPSLRSYEGADLSDSFAAPALACNLERAVSILRRVIDQTVHRVIKGEKVPASEKVVSFSRSIPTSSSRSIGMFNTVSRSFRPAASPI
jgi:IS5 family transposase